MAKTTLNPFYNDFTDKVKSMIGSKTLSKKKAKEYASEFIEKQSDNPINFGSLGYLTYKRTYSRQIDENKFDQTNTETYYQTINRVIQGSIDVLNIKWSKKEIEAFVKGMLDLKINVSGRELWQTGSKLFNKGEMSSLINCWYFNIDKWSAFHKIFDMLMLGGGVGFSVQKHHIEQLDTIKSKVKLIDKKDFDAKKVNKDYTVLNITVGDSREGWCKLLDTVIMLHQAITKTIIVVDSDNVRKAGEPIKGFGGVSSGFSNCYDGMFTINEIMNNAIGRKLGSVELTDMVCIIAYVVVSGNVRRSALLALGDKFDSAFYTMKRFDKYKAKETQDFNLKGIYENYKLAQDGKIPNYRYSANLSINTSTIDDLDEEIWKGFTEAGEPIGFVNINNCQKFGRTNKDDEIYYQYRFGSKIADPDVEGVNPCAEATLPDNSNCNLSENYISNWLEELSDLDLDIAGNRGLDFSMTSDDKLMLLYVVYRIKKHITQGSYRYKDIEKRINKDSRIGIGMTGILSVYNHPKFQTEVDKAYRFLITLDYFYSKKHDMPYARKLTVVKPSGTLSLLPDVLSGIHAGYSKYYMRTIRISSNNYLWKVAQELGYKVEDNVSEANSKVVYFPMKHGENDPVFSEFGSIAQMEAVKTMQKVWADQSISVTIYYDKETLPEIIKWLSENYSSSLKTISFLQHSGHGFKQAVLSPITEEEYNKEVAQVTPITENAIQQVLSSLSKTELKKFKNAELNDDVDSSCEGGICPTR